VQALRRACASLLGLLLLAAAASAGAAEGELIRLDASRSEVGFKVKVMWLLGVNGRFGKVEGTVRTDPFRNRLSVDARIDVASVSMGRRSYEDWVKSDEFFDVAHYPEIRFVSTAASLVDSETWALTGDLTIKDVTKPVTITFEYTGSATDPFGNQRVGFEGAVTVNRKDWGLTWNAALETGGVLVSEKVKLEFDVSAIAAPATA